MLAFSTNKGNIINALGLNVILHVFHHEILLYVLFFVEAILSGGNEGSLSSESDASDDDYDSSKGRWCFCILQVCVSCNGLYDCCCTGFLGNHNYVHK